MHYITPDLCDAYPELIQVVEPMFSNFGGRDSFGGEIVTVKCFEDNSLVKEQVEQPGKGKVMVVDGGASMRRALLGDMLAEKAAKNGWEGLVIYGCVRDVDALGVDAGILHRRAARDGARARAPLDRPLEPVAGAGRTCLTRECDVTITRRTATSTPSPTPWRTTCATL